MSCVLSCKSTWIFRSISHGTDMRTVVFRGGGCYCFVGSFELRGVELRERERDIIPGRGGGGGGGGEAIRGENSPSV